MENMTSVNSTIPFHNIVNTILLIFIPQTCCDKFLLEFDFFNVECLKVLISKVLGYAIILGSVLVKFPQIVKILRAKSAKGISFTGQTLELLAVSWTSAYSLANGFPFSAYGEGIFLCLQTSTISFLTLFFGGMGPMSFAFIGTYGGLMAYLCSAHAPMRLLQVLQTANMPITASGKMVQIISNFRNGNTGQLSAVTIFLLTLGSVARIFTSMQETGDTLMVLTHVVASSCNLIQSLQILYYWNVTDNTSNSNVDKSKKMKPKKA